MLVIHKVVIFILITFNIKDEHIIVKCKTIEKYLFFEFNKIVVIDNIFYKMRLNKKSG